MEGTWIKTWIALPPAVAAILLFFLFMRMQALYHPERVILKKCEEFRGFLKSKSKESSWYRQKQVWLCKNGAEFHYGAWLNPVCYLAMKIIASVLGGAVLFPVVPRYGILAGILLFFLPDMLLVYLNRKDNEWMLSEIKLVYHALEIQIRAGVYVTDALAECYGSVQEKRLRQAFLDLAGDIVMKADIYEALDCFQGKFDNRYIDSLCITIFQALESGQAVELLSDIGNQIKDMETMVLERKKALWTEALRSISLECLRRYWVLHFTPA